VDVVTGAPVPQLVGQNIGVIQGWAAQNNIKLSPVQVASDQAQGIIVRQSPAAGAPLAAGEVVTVYVSNGPAQVAIPSLQGQSFEQAKAQLEQLGFQVQPTHLGPGDTVFGTNPSGSAPAGSMITVYYGGL